MEHVTQEQFKILEEKVDKILSIVSSIDANTTPCEEKQNASKMSVEMITKMLDQSPLKDNPMIRGMLESMIPIMNGGRG